jgi:hypothetical protein
MPNKLEYIYSRDSKHFIFFVAYEWTQQARVLFDWKGFPGANTLAYLVHSYVMKKMKCCESSPRPGRPRPPRYLNYKSYL